MTAIQFGKFLIVLGLLLFASGSRAQNNPEQKPHYIGKASMSADGTITLDLFMTGDGKPLDGHFTYKTDDRDYQTIIRHVGGIKPGETKPVPPFPDKRDGG